ncbi:MAG: cupin domain-containing protein [Streptosporangiaceae bacterium]
MPPGTREVRHFHLSTVQFYFVLSGTAVVLLGDRSLTVTPGYGIEITPLVPHQMRNDNDTTLEFLVISSRAPRSDRIDLAD